MGTSGNKRLNLSVFRFVPAGYHVICSKKITKGWEEENIKNIEIPSTRGLVRIQILVIRCDSICRIAHVTEGFTDVWLMVM